MTILTMIRVLQEGFDRVSLKEPTTLPTSESAECQTFDLSRSERQFSVLPCQRALN